MENVYRNFYRNFYMRTNGFIPVSPLGKTVYPGDFFQIRNGQMIALGNIFRNGLIEPQEVALANHNKLNPEGWSFSDGVSKPYAGRGNGNDPLKGEFVFSKQILAFAERGNFIFKASDPESIRILNWSDIQQILIIRLTQTHYSFREVYVVTESAAAADWTLAVSGGNMAELEIVTDHENFGLVDIFGHHSSKTIQSKDIEFYHREEKRKSSFYKAKKLVVREEKTETLAANFIAQWEGHNEWAQGFYEQDFHFDYQYVNNMGTHSQGNLLDLLPPNELNPSTALLYFKWADTSLDDVEKLLINYGE